MSRESEDLPEYVAIPARKAASFQWLEREILDQILIRVFLCPDKRL